MNFTHSAKTTAEPSVFFYRNLPAMRDMSLILPVLTQMI